MTNSPSQTTSTWHKGNPWLGFGLLAPLTLVLVLLSRSGLEGSLRSFVILGVVTLQAVLASRLLLGVQGLPRSLKVLLSLILLFVLLLLLMPTWQMLGGPAQPVGASSETPNVPATEGASSNQEAP